MLIYKFEDLPSEEALILYGGSFNPPHISHVLFAVTLHMIMPQARVLVAPTWSHAFNKTLMAYETRLEMLHSIFDGMPGIEVSTIERDLHESTSYTIDVVRALKVQNPHSRILVAVGADIVETLPQWRSIDELNELCDFLIFPRTGYEAKALPIPALPEVSSTQIREALALGTPKAMQWVRSYVPAHVLRVLETAKTVF